jgi:hypothetical protein
MASPRSKDSETGPSGLTGFLDTGTVAISGLFGAKAKRAAERQATIAAVSHELKAMEGEPDIFDARRDDSPEEEKSKEVEKFIPELETIPEAPDKSFPPFQDPAAIPRDPASAADAAPPVPQAPANLPPPQEVVPHTSYQKFRTDLDMFSRQLATAVENLYPYRITQAGLKVNEAIRTHIPDEKAYLKLSAVERVDYALLLNYLAIAIGDYRTAYKEKHPLHAYNRTLRDLGNLATRVEGGRSIGKIIGGLAMILVGVISAALILTATFATGGILGLTAAGLFPVCGTLVSAGVAAVGGVVAYNGRRKGLSEELLKFENAIDFERRTP